MNSTLYDINARYMQALDAATDPESDLSPDLFTDTLQGIEGEAEDKLKAVIAYSRNLEVEAEAIKDALDAMKSRLDAKRKRSQWLKDYAKESMMILGKSKLEWPEFAARIQANPPAVEIIDPQKIPDDFKAEVVEVKIDKKAISERLKAGEYVPGAVLRQGESLRVK
jgi:Siphovirus Gp157